MKKLFIVFSLSSLIIACGSGGSVDVYNPPNNNGGDNDTGKGHVFPSPVLTQHFPDNDTSTTDNDSGVDTSSDSGVEDSGDLDSSLSLDASDLSDASSNSVDASVDSGHHCGGRDDDRKDRE